MNDIKEIMARAAAYNLTASCQNRISWEDAMETTQFQLERLAEAGFVIVHKEVNDDMLKRLKAKNYLDVKFIKAIYKAMIEASQGGEA